MVEENKQKNPLAGKINQNLKIVKLWHYKIGKKRVLVTLVLVISGVLSITLTVKAQQYITNLRAKASDLESSKSQIEQELENISQQFEDLKNEDQYLRNSKLEEDLGHIKETYTEAISVYEELLKLKEKTDKTDDFDKAFTESLLMLTEKNYASASAKLAELSGNIKKEEEKIAEELAKAAIPKAVAVNEPPGSGYRRQQVKTDVGTFLVSIVAADLSNARVIVDTASAGDCHNNCPVMSLAQYVSRNNAFAGVNGSYFCPATYPSCAGKTNSFDTLLMNKNKVYFNSGNNVYSNVPAVIFGSGWIRFVGQSLEWGRDTSIDSMLANQALLVQGGNISFGGDQDPKKGSRGGRSFVANKGSMVYIGVVHSATVIESGRVLHAMGMENALNLDNGGSTTLWSGGYRVGPGRNLPNVILFVRK